MESLLVLSIGLLAAGWLVAHAIDTCRKTLRGAQGCSAGCGARAGLDARQLVPVSALLRPRGPA